MAFDGSSGLAIVRTVTSTAFSPLRSVRRTSSPGFRRPIWARSSVGVLTGVPSTATITSPGSREAAAGTSGDTVVTRTPAGSGNDVVPQLAQRNHRGGLLGPRHVRGVLAVALGVGLARRRENLLGDEGRALGPRERQELLEQADPTHEEVDVVDVALRVRLPAFDLDLVGERLGAIGDEEEVVGRKPPEHERRDEAEHAEHDRRAGEALHGARYHRPRVSAPSTRTTVPLTYEARAEHRNAATSPISRVVPSRPSGMVARSSSVGPSG